MNFLRKAIAEIKNSIPILKNEEYTNTTNLVFERSLKAQKFILPNGGRIFDTSFKALPDILNLPFSEIVIEYSCVGLSGGIVEEQIGDAAVLAPNRIVFARQQENGISVYVMVEYKLPIKVLQEKLNIKTKWMFMPYAAFISNTSSGDTLLTPLISEKPIIKSASGNYIGISYYDIGGLAKKSHGDNWLNSAVMDLNDEVGSVLALIEALSCKNVQIEKLPIRKLNKSAKKRGVLPFDEYSVLTVNRTDKNYVVGDGTHRSPREHLRRGHIRRLSIGNIWVNSTVVNPNVSGKINKIYKLEKEAA